MAKSINILIIILACFYQNVSGQMTYDGNDCINKKFQVAAHIAVDSSMRLPIYEQQELDSILILTSSFFDQLCISFQLCEYNILENDYTLGIIRSKPISIETRFTELRNRFSMRRRINIFVLQSIEDVDCGAGTHRGIHTLRDANVFLELDCEEGLHQQLAHQLGHVFGLLDTYNADEIELVDGSNCEIVADRICDTPADPFEQDFVSQKDSIRLLREDLRTDFVVDCQFVYELRDPNDNFYAPLIGNIMSGYPCKCFFTQEQLSLMKENFLSSKVQHF